ncbi:MAG: hypothetical protein COY39_04625 [Alphaproteobacteria bacterium CG_4_10_14_0_8_um_filter_37_21]|nr:MAG: hypothetical protein COY39_04625 [Alphaproteobacteria bacterium CG_4_10_14_0_8_um_filter_37_21]
MKKNILAWCSVFMVNTLSAQDLRVHEIRIELDQIEALQDSLARRADFLRDQENFGERGGLAGAMPADQLDLDLQKRLEKLRDEERDAINAAQVTGLTGAEIKQTQSTVDSIRFK